jgi:hypothetical protein
VVVKYDDKTVVDIHPNEGVDQARSAFSLEDTVSDVLLE